MSKPILITGGAGFIGSHLVEFFDNDGIDYNVLDSLSTGSMHNIPAAISKNRFIKADVNNNELLKDLISSTSLVIHLASTVGVQNVLLDPIKSIDTNINSLNNIAYNCSINNVPLVFFSTSLVYSPEKEKKVLFSESDQTHTLGFHPVSMYVYSKKVGELLCDYYMQHKHLKYIIIRPFNMIGIRQRKDVGMVVPTFIDSALQKRSISIFGDGTQTRTFSDVKVAVRLLWKIISDENSYGQIFNLATTEKSTSILQLAELIKDILSDSVSINFIPISEVYGSSYRDVNYRAPSLAKLKKVTPAWTTRPLEDVLKEIIEFEKLKMKSSPN